MRATARRTAATIALLAGALSAHAVAAEPEATVVRSRLYTADGRFELQLNFQTGVAATLTSTYGLMLDGAYHLTESLAIDVLAGWFFGGVTDLFGEAQCPMALASGGSANCLAPNVSVFKANASGLSDLPNLWTLSGLNAQAGLRWEPIYGKISLFAALPVHFKWYLALDGGIAQFSRDSLDFCTAFDNATGDCNIKEPSSQQFNGSSGSSTYLTFKDTRLSWVASAATGFRFLLLPNAELNLGLREYLWGDSYRVNFTAAQFGPKPSPSIQNQGGVTPSLFCDLGIGWTF